MLSQRCLDETWPYLLSAYSFINNEIYDPRYRAKIEIFSLNLFPRKFINLYFNFTIFRHMKGYHTRLSLLSLQVEQLASSSPTINCYK